jgi:outer membrane protein
MIPVLLVLALHGRVLELTDAVKTAEQHQPQLKQAQANSEVYRWRADEARAPLLPQLLGTAQYLRSTGNFAPRPGVFAVNPPPASANSQNYFNFGLQLNQFVWDFGQTTDKWKAAKETASAQVANEHATHLQIVLGVRSAYFTARAQKALVEVAHDTLANQERHLNQIKEYVDSGIRPEIDRLQAETDFSNAEVQLINAENGYETAKLQLNQAMGIIAPIDYDVSDAEPGAVDGEESAIEPLVEEAAKDRPELASLSRQIRAQELLVSSAKGGYGPSIQATAQLSDAGTDLGNLGWNGFVGVNVNWSIFSGLLTVSQVNEAHATLRLLVAQRDQIVQQVRVEVDQARLAVRAAKATITAADKALANARARLGLAENRYKEGVGSIIELGDAQVAVTQAAGQKVQADFNLATARAQLMKALGRS